VIALNIDKRTSLIINDDLVSIDFAIIGVLVGGYEVILVIKLNEGIAAGLTLLIADDPHGFNDTVLLGGKKLTSNSYFRVFYVVL
jgi:hypothetical protein